MHWLANAAARAGLRGADTLQIPRGATTTEAWEIAARALGLSATELAEGVASAVRLRPADLESAQTKAVRLLPEKLARKYKVLPLREDDRTLVVATADPSDLEVEQAVGFASGRRAVFELAPPHAIEQAIEGAYTQDRSVETLLSSVDAELADTVRVVEEMAPETINLQEAEAAPVVKLANLILRDAVVSRASDVHVEPGPRGGTVRFRIDGVMRVQMHLPMAALNRVVSRIKILGKLDIADRMRPQDGRTRVQVDGRTYDLRISTVPTRDAEKAVLRVLRPDTAKSLADAGIPERELARLRQLLAMRDGIVVVTGPTGSGKTTTLYAAIKEVATGEVNVMTVEDPVEYELPGITQIQVDPKRGVTFASALRAILRQDPDVIFVGEIRDLETAEVAVQAALTGHLVLGTLHTNDAMSAVARLADLGLDRPSIAASLRGALAQRLVRRVCPDCAQAVTAESALTTEEERLAAAFGVRPAVRAVGCKRCGNTGYRGRLPIQEVAIVTPAMTEQIASGATSAQLQRAAALNGMRGLREVALERVAAGDTTLQEIERVLGERVEEESAGAKEAPPTVLVVDDDPVTRRLARALLEGGGMRVLEAADGQQALERVGTGEDLSLVVTDVQMPAMSGGDLLRRLRASAATAALPVIVLTGAADVDTEVALMEAGADDYIRKPLDPPRFMARVKASLRRASL